MPEIDRAAAEKIVAPSAGICRDPIGVRPAEALAPLAVHAKDAAK